jgi:DNA-binding IclR family transcriptional regulator
VDAPVSALSSDDDRYIVPAVDRALKFLELLSGERREIPLVEITRRLALPHATAFRLAYTLEQHGLLRRSDTGYAIGPRILTLGFDYLASQDLLVVARPELTRLRDETGVSANLGVRDGREVIYTCHIGALGALTSRTEVGNRLFAHASSMGRVLLSAMSAEALVRLYEGVDLPQLPHTVSDPDAILQQAIEDRQRGWVMKIGVYERDLVAVAVPVIDGSGNVAAAINLSGPTSAMGPIESANPKIQQLRECAARISRQLGHRG